MAALSLRSVQVHRRAVSAALRDYSAFAAWQYTRRASDYLRLTIANTAAYGAARRGPVELSTECRIAQQDGNDHDGCLTPRPTEGYASCAVSAGAVTVTLNNSRYSDAVVDTLLADALASALRTGSFIGMRRLPGERPVYLGYAFHTENARTFTGCDAVVLTAQAFPAVLRHVARFAPLLPPTFVGALPNDSLVTIQVETADHQPLVSIGERSIGMASRDVLGPDLADLNAVVTLHPIATARLVAGGIPASNLPALVAMLVVTLVLCAASVVQIRRTQDVVRARAAFVASVSHELKTPLAQISLFADTLAGPRERDADERRRYLTIISREAKRLGHLVDGILYFAAMRGRDITDVREPSMIGEEIRDVVAAFEPLAAARGASIDVDIDQEIELPLDRDAFRQLLLNLLDNALKFGPDAQHITLTTRLAEGRVRLTVDDQGPGVPEADRVRVFEPFARANGSVTTAGSGIGLAIVQDVVRRHDGTVRLGAGPGGGARVEVMLPSATVVVWPTTAAWSS